MTAQHQFLTTVVVAGRPLEGFQTRSGGETTSEVGKYRPSGGAKQRGRKGLTDHADVTVGREWERERDLELVHTLRPSVGRAPMVVTEQPLDEDGVAFGRPTVYTGTLTTLNDGESDANGEDGRMLELTMVVLDIT